MSKNTTINIQVDSEIKEEAGEILESMGLSLSQAFNLMLRHVRVKREFPFEMEEDYYDYKPNAETLALIDRIESGEEQMAGPFKTFEEYKAWLAEDDDE